MRSPPSITTCPYCKASNTKIKPPNASWITWVVVAIFVVIGLSGLSMLGSSSVVSMAKYSQIQNGMTYGEVVNIIGSQGQELSRNSMDSIPGVMSSISTVMYSWQNPGGSNMNAMFQNDRLISKAQFGLK
jgi:hypothetical protein